MGANNNHLWDHVWIAVLLVLGPEAIVFSMRFASEASFWPRMVFAAYLVGKLFPRNFWWILHTVVTGLPRYFLCFCNQAFRYKTNRLNKSDCKQVNLPQCRICWEREILIELRSRYHRPRVDKLIVLAVDWSRRQNRVVVGLNDVAGELYAVDSISQNKPVSFCWLRANWN